MESDARLGTQRRQTPRAGERRKAVRAQLPAKQCFGLLCGGLVPFLGVALCLGWAFGERSGPQKRAIAKAMLGVHAIGMTLLILGLCVWLLIMAGVLPPLNAG